MSNKGNPGHFSPPPPPYPVGEGYTPGSQLPHVVVSQPQVQQVIVTSLGPGPTATHCPGCNQQVVTKTSYETGALTWILCVVIFIFGGFCGCCLIPFCVGSCQDVVHHCPYCKRSLGAYKRM
ncbi:hypothetical protein CRM22_010736 [Opisthorchis felineus]|uniref:LITAF domain-containing protein n=1 Tax=Opisthorchis felineus TaxID=147828 RepID=A0A4S2KPB8_OPIFE|nr:hypothetical protein CRM22_010736 [Opisthorchis felineus]